MLLLQKRPTKKKKELPMHEGQTETVGLPCLPPCPAAHTLYSNFRYKVSDVAESQHY